MKKKSWEVEDWKAAGAIIGKNVVGIDSFIDVAFPYLIEIGDDTVLTGATILAHDASTHRELGYSKIGVTSIGKRCFLGHGCIVMPGISIGDDCIIGAGTVVSQDVESGSVFAGGRRICSTNSYFAKHKARMEDPSIPVFNDVPHTKEEQTLWREALREKGGYAK